jgi:outer membrane protein assembly factor BamB
VKFCTLMLTFLVALGGCRATAPKETPVGPVPPGSFVQNWSSQTGYKTVKALHHVGDMIFVYGENNQVTAYDTNGGAKFKIKVAQAGDILGEPMVSADRVVIPTSSTLEVYTRSNGVLRRTMNLKTPIRSPGVLIDNVVYIGIDAEHGGEIAAIDLDRPYNVIKWSRLVGVVRHRPALHEGTLYFTNEAGRVFALTTEPKVAWPITPQMPGGQFQTDGDVNAPVSADDAGVFVSATDTKLYAIDPVGGRIRWTYYSGIPLQTSPQITADTVYQFVDGQGLTALDKKPGGPNIRQPRWTNRDARLVLADDAQYAYVLHAGGIAALDKKTGQERFATKRSDFVKVTENLSAKDNTIYVLTRDNTLRAIKPVTRAGVVGQLVMAPATEEVAQR